MGGVGFGLGFRVLGFRVSSGLDEISVQSTTSQEVLTAQCLSLIFFDSVSAREFVLFPEGFFCFFFRNRG